MRLNLLLFLIFLFGSCNQNRKQNEVKKNVNNYICDTVFEVNKMLYSIWQDTSVNGSIPCVVLMQNGQLYDTILTFKKLKSVGYYLKDFDGNGFIDIRRHRLHEWGGSHYYLFNPQNNKFVENGIWSNYWVKLSKNIFYSQEIPQGDMDLHSDLFKIENGKITGLGYIKINIEEDNIFDNDEVTGVTLYKIKNGNFKDIEWQKEISKSEFRPFFNKNTEGYEHFYKFIWTKNQSKFK
jgi:hypothetical protein